MKYIYPLTNPYSYLNHILDRANNPLEYSVFSDIMFNYIQACVRRWLFNCDYHSCQNMLSVGLKYLLSKDEVDNFLVYLDNQFWPMVSNTIEDNINADTVVIVTIISDGSLMLEIKPDKTELEKTIERVCVEVEHKLDSGAYVDPTLLEIYNASRNHTFELQN